MILRALIVLLVVINVGVAAWWTLRAPSPPPPVAADPAGVPRLQLLREATRPSAPSASAPAATIAATSPSQCVSFGPYPTPAALRRAHDRVRPLVLDARVREVAAGRVRGWRVFMPPMPTRAEAQAVGERLRAAGFDDLLVIADGSDANGIALGRFSNEDTARRHQTALQAAGFTATVSPLGDVGTLGWIDVAADATFDRARTAQDIAAAQVQTLDCAAMAAAPTGTLQSNAR